MSFIDVKECLTRTIVPFGVVRCVLVSRRCWDPSDESARAMSGEGDSTLDMRRRMS